MRGSTFQPMQAECNVAYWICKSSKPKSLVLCHRQQIFGTYIDALIKLEDAAKPKAAADFRVCILTAMHPLPVMFRVNEQSSIQ